MTASRPDELSPTVTMTLDELSKMQAVAGIHITFSVTLACPLKCAHCIVDAGPDKGLTTMPLEVARHYASQMGELYDYGIRIISLTGGEPFLAQRQVKVLSDAALDSGMKTGVVTAAHWATSADAARKLIGKFPGIKVWDVSIDSYHEEYVSFDRVRIAYEAIREAGRRAVLRFTYHDPMTDADRRILNFIREFADERDICSQRVRSVGRASQLPIFPANDHPTFAKPCWTKGLVVRYDGSMAPCCISLVEERSHPFQFGDASTRPLAQIHAEYMSHPLLQMLRVIGFGEVMRWIDESRIDRGALAYTPEDVCDLCPQIFANEKWSEYLSRRAGTPENRLRIAILMSRLLGEHTMLRRTVEELAPQAGSIEGFELAARLAAETGSGVAPAATVHCG
jgi:pyruvate-formate lyase-activating enzyme